MTTEISIKLFTDMLWMGVIISAPILAIALAIGIAVSVLQVITQIQEMSLTFIPKVIAVVAALIILGPWMTKKMVTFAIATISQIPHYF